MRKNRFFSIGATESEGTSGSTKLIVQGFWLPSSKLIIMSSPFSFKMKYSSFFYLNGLLHQVVCSEALDCGIFNCENLPLML
jgi:hypothetical protein